jgi:hypothetical protein
MKSFISVIVTLLCFFVFTALYWLWINGQTRAEHKGKTPPINNPTMFDVRRLLKEGDREGAIRYYARIFKVSARQARKDVEELERSLKV